MTVLLLSLVAVCTIGSGVAEPQPSGPVQQPLGRPVIGILASPFALFPGESTPHPTRSIIPTRYVDSLNDAGADSVPLFLHRGEEELAELAGKLNGVLFTGGSDDDGVHGLHYPDVLMSTAAFLVNLTSEAYRLKGSPLPIWATCQGFQLLSVLYANDPRVVVQTYGTAPQLSSLNFTRAAVSSRLFRNASELVMHSYATENSTLNLHQWGVLASQWGDEKIDGKIHGLRLLATSVDSHGQIYGAAMEHESLPIYATQFHPEIKPWSIPMLPVDKPTLGEQAAARYPMDFFVEEARTSGRHFATAEEERQHLIQRWPVINVTITKDGKSFSMPYYGYETEADSDTVPEQAIIV